MLYLALGALGAWRSYSVDSNCLIVCGTPLMIEARVQHLEGDKFEPSRPMLLTLAGRGK